MFLLSIVLWMTVAASYPFSESYMWHDVDIDMSNIDVVITLANGSTPHYGTVVNTEADVHISNMVITLPNSTVINTGPMILYISTYHQDLYDIVMSAAGFTEDFVKSLRNRAAILKVKLQPNNTITQSFGPRLFDDGRDGDLDEDESAPDEDFASDLDENTENLISTLLQGPTSICFNPINKS